MSLAALSFVIAGLGLVGWLSGRMRAARFRREPGAGFNALPAHHAAYVMMWTVAPAALFVGIWATTSPALVTADVLRSPAARGLPEAGFERAAILSEARAIATREGFGREGFGREGFGREGFGREGFGARTTGGRSTGDLDPRSATLAPAYADAQSRYDTIASGAAVLLAFSAGALAYLRVRPQFRARRRVETVIMAALLCASLIAILATLGIVASLLFETLRFFRLVPLSDFLLGTHWSPQSITRLDPGAVLGAVPLFWGTFFIGAIIAMAVAVPLGLMTAIYLTQYARPAVRRALKPSIEILAGVPTVVYGYFAALTVAPAVRDLGVALHLPGASSESALAAGLVIGVMIIPFVSSMADDSIAAVPASMRDGSLAMGATLAETIRRVLLPAALPGVVGGILLAVSRAIGETMIVVMAASGVATLSLNPFASATTVTKQIVDLLTGEAAFDSPKTLAAFALGLTLFAVTLLLNIVALIVVKRYREAYD